MHLLETLHHLIPYRLNAVETFGLVLRNRDKWGSSASMQLILGENLVVEGNSNAFTNPVIEAGIIHGRALLEFLGLGMSKDGKLQSLKRPRLHDDVGIEHFSSPAGQLAMVSPAQAVSRWPGGTSEAEEALLSVFRAANKGLAHLTSSAVVSPEETRLLEIASRGVPALVVSYLYTPLQLPPPKHQITSRLRGAG